MHSRHYKILDMLQGGRLEIVSAARKLGVSEMTLRRDLRELEKQKLLIQVKGGALPLRPLGGEAAITDPLLNLKTALAQKLYERLMPCETLFLSTGSTVLRFAVLLARYNTRPSTVITNSLSVASALFRSSCKVILLGGEMRTSQMDLAGPAAERILTEYHVEWLVTGCDGAITPWGFYTSDLSLSNLEKKSIGIAEHTAVITDSSKFSHKSLSRFAAPEEIDILVTDKNIPQKDLESLKGFPHLEIITVDYESAPMAK